MGNRTAVLCRLLLVAGIANAGAHGASAQSAALPRVRSTHAYIRAMIEEATTRSSTLRRLVAAIAETNGIVYVEQGDCGHSVRACLTLSVTPAGDYRFLRVLVDARQPDWEVMASIGHELQHALEVLGEPALKTSESIFLFYVREGLTMGDSFETPEAIRAGDAVRGEVGAYKR